MVNQEEIPDWVRVQTERDANQPLREMSMGDARVPRLLESTHRNLTPTLTAGRSSTDGRSAAKRISAARAMTLLLSSLHTSVGPSSLSLILFSPLLLFLFFSPFSLPTIASYYDSFILLQSSSLHLIHYGCYSLPHFCSRCAALRSFGYSQSCRSCGLHSGPGQGYSS